MNIGSEVEISTIEKQRKELQLLIGELKDRDKELNDMVAVHQQQLLSWEEDRQKVLTLEERCSKLEGELHKRTEIIRSLTKKDDFSPTSKLQRLLAESRQMVTDLELSTLLPISHENLTGSATNVCVSFSLDYICHIQTHH
ncbi:hypothetical protein H8959_015060 [Pygathrix nigripes]